MSSNDYSGNYLVLDDDSIVLSSGQTRHDAMTASDPPLYMQEEGQFNNVDSDVVSYCTGPSGFLVRLSRASYELMKLAAQYTFVSHTVSGNATLRLVSKTSALVVSLETGLKSVGLQIASGYAKDFTGTGRATAGWILMNTKLQNTAPIQIWRP